jgi:hypothetical protein
VVFYLAVLSLISVGILHTDGDVTEPTAQPFDANRMSDTPT